MTEQNHTTPQPLVTPQVVPQRKPWTVEKKERRLLPLALALAFLAVSLLLDNPAGGRWMWLPGFGVTAMAAGWYAVLFLYRGTSGMEKRVNQILMAAVTLLALTFTLFSNQWFRFWNCGALILLVAVHTWELCGGTRFPWHSAGMLFERMRLLIQGPFVRCGAMLDTVKALRGGKHVTRWIPAAVGTAVTLPALWLVASVLMDADALFALVAGNALAELEHSLGEAFIRLAMTVCAVPFVFSLLYYAAHTEQTEKQSRTRKRFDSLPAVMLLGALDGLYLFFLAVQSTALFGGREYLQQAGISFAEYARSGFFQLVGLAGLNAAVILTALWVCQEDRRIQVLATVLVGLTGVLLVSAGWRMTLYAAAYGLSFRRILTYWGMGMLAILLALTVRKIWRKDFQFFRTAAPVALAGWLLLNYCNVDALAARYNSARTAAGSLPQSAVDGLLTSFSYDGLEFLGDTGDSSLTWLRENAAEDCRNWTTWSVSAWRAARR